MTNHVKTCSVDDTTYTIHPHHRDKNPSKSQWSISPDNEIATFTNAKLSCWLINDSGWGVFPVSGTPTYLGVSKDQTTQLIIAKFVFNESNNNWHGYPANHIENVQDIPDEIVLKQWIEKSILSRAKISKIGKGKPCKL